jgi:D-arabinose 1-dehydrogenase-like Zn-dependent alcohol dehydrogenase
MARTHEPVAVLGIGAMGHGMAASALRTGIPTIVWNRTREATRDLAELGAEVAATAAVQAQTQVMPGGEHVPQLRGARMISSFSWRRASAERSSCMSSITSQSCVGTPRASGAGRPDGAAGNLRR